MLLNPPKNTYLRSSHFGISYVSIFVPTFDILGDLYTIPSVFVGEKN